MTNSDYLNTQTALVQCGQALNHLDLNAFRDRIRTADSAGAIIDPTLYRAAAARLQLIDELARAAFAMQAAFHNLEIHARQELEQLQNGETSGE